MHTIQQLQSGELKGNTHIKIKCGLKQFPDELFTLSETLEYLDLSGNELTSLPYTFNVFNKLKILFLSDNKFTEFPEVLGQCNQLDIIGFKANHIETMSDTSLPKNTRWLILTNNKLKQLPTTIGNCLRMQKLMLAGNQLTTLPDELANCKNLGLLRISANKLETLPQWLVEMPKLAWLAFSGNPFCNDLNVEKPLVKDYNWNNINLINKLGEGASGMIWEATLSDETKAEQLVAIKLFKGSITSDGLPADEMNVALTAGNHTNLVNVLGKIINHPENKNGLVLSLIPSNYVNLGNPPSLVSCTRDVFTDGNLFNMKQTLNIAKSMANVGKFLHEKGIVHGDLYAHNILIDKEGNALFGDFGAASIYNKQNKVQANRLEKMEVLGFGYLLDDLINITTIENDEEKTLLNKMIDLKNNCLKEVVVERPDFNFITTQL